VHDYVDQFHFKVTSKIPILVVKRAKEAYFGKTLMRSCTVRGTGTSRSSSREACRIETVFD